jgi:multisubunit Na+/H+ antiporter MnhB subunit
MADKLWRPLVLLPWLSLPLFVGTYLADWNKLPEQLVIHFDWRGTPDGSMGRGLFLALAVGVLLLLLISFSNSLLPKYQDRRSLWSLVSFYLLVTAITYIFLQLLDYNIYSIPIRWVTTIIVVLAAGLVPVAASLFTKRADS